MKRHIILAIVFLAFGLVSANAQSVADFYKGKSIRVIVGASAGGSYDTVARMMSRNMKRHVPGNPRMITQNRTGASSRVAANWLYNAGPRDGTVIGSFSQTLAFAQVVGQRKVKYDSQKFQWIGTPIQPISVMIAWHNAGIKHLLDAQKKQFIVGATSSTGANFIYPALANYLFGTKLKIVIGYKGGTQVDLALERGEVAMRGSGTWSDIKGNRSHWITQKLVVPLVQNSLVKHVDLPNVPRFIDLATKPEQRAVLELMGKVASIGRPMLTNRGVPADRVAALRKAFDDTMKDPVFLTEAKRFKLDVNPMRGEDIQKLVAEILATPQSVIDTTNAALSRKAVKCKKFTKKKYCRNKKKKKKKKK
ncbi:MAG: Bug family tripartite tricarboxylate transporter substrate binding protein [Alphaproteobacteria bacterium]|jgi:tripartite-type tricarboxylate transporter receptor subunit TctC